METRRILDPVIFKASHIVTITLAGFIVFTARPNSNLFSWHPTLMAITFLILMFEAVLVINSDHSPLDGSPRSTQILFHQIVNMSSFTCAILGFIAIFYHKDISGSDHFTTWHGIMGISTLFIHFLQIIGGMLTKYRYPSVQKLLNLKLNGMDLKIFHSSFGLLLFAMVWCTIICAMFSAWYSSHVTGIWWSICLLCAVFLAILKETVEDAIKSTLKTRLPSMVIFQGYASKNETAKETTNCIVINLVYLLFVFTSLFIALLEFSD